MVFLPPDLEGTRLFLIACLRSRWDPAALDEARAIASQPGWDWERMLQAARLELITPLLYKCAQGCEFFPPSVESDLLRGYQHSRSRNILVFKRLQVILADLQQAQIPVIVLKGGALALALYGDAALRPLSDLDLLIPGDERGRALELFRREGYSTGMDRHPESSQVYENEILLTKAEAVPIPVELHWTLFDSPYYQAGLSLNWFWQTAAPYEVFGAPAWMFGWEAQLIHLCAHLMFHHTAAELLWLHDIAELAARRGHELDWGLVIQQAKAFKLVLPIQTVLLHLLKEWELPIEASILGRLRAMQPSEEEERQFRLLTTKQRPAGRRFLDDLAGAPTLMARMRFALDNLFPSPAYMRERYHIRSSLLLPWYYPYRWIRGLRSLRR